jgi:hypothetical protein
MSLEWLITSGRIADVILAIVAIEAILTLFLIGRSSGLAACRGPLAGLAAGASLVLALRAALTGAGWPAIALFLSLGLVSHVAEVLWRAR